MLRVPNKRVNMYIRNVLTQFTEHGQVLHSILKQEYYIPNDLNTLRWDVRNKETLHLTNVEINMKLRYK